jgi:hypothetical protein
MPRISQQKKDKISEQILYYLYTVSPEPLFTNKIAQEIARDEEFTKAILTELKLKSLIIEVNKNPTGQPYKKRQRWRIATKTHEAYSKHQ